ncbi:hypothetical protein LUX12_00850 [Streptomyces somaliensis]|uniref:hypothetical protein n=1 Tax=Streptomyces somaliensis TaxID=78355 RepID=UPI0020CBA6D8|nr:hypothetical protein [Streptomyces somaliensis]MCP9943676.1 hypothetical protein [Streptomyces somaliensis]MCP9975927.1 hypothetical protein [Streptomyces somaliensis]
MEVVPEIVATVAALGGAAVVQAATTDAWTSVKAWLVPRLGGGDREREQAESLRLDASAAVLRATAGVPEVAEERRRQEEAQWRARFLEFLGGMPEDRVAEMQRELRALLDGLEAGRPSASGGGDINAVGNTFNRNRDVHIGHRNTYHGHGSPEPRA